MSNTITEDQILKSLDRSRTELLDLSTRNRMISTPLDSPTAKLIETIGDSSDQVFRLLVKDGKALSFVPHQEEPKAKASYEIEVTSASHAENHELYLDQKQDSRLRTNLTTSRLQDRLLDLYYESETCEQEQGIGVLYIAIGFLKWFEADSSDLPRYSPLLLIPVRLERANVVSKFYLKFREEDVTTNLSLQAKMHAEFGARLPEVPEMEEIVPSSYFESVRSAIEGLPRWEVISDKIVLSFFSFAKFLMYRDLDPANWPKDGSLLSHPAIQRLLGSTGFEHEPMICDDNSRIDSIIPSIRQLHVTDADSSQAIVIEEVNQGRNLVIQGPPGTGKSQTITNIIASAVKQGKSVLFVAEKMAALEVVYRRLEQVGLESICLELHSRKANKKTVLNQISHILNVGRPKTGSGADTITALDGIIERLNKHSEFMNAPLEKSGFTPFEVLGRLNLLYESGVKNPDSIIEGGEHWTRDRYIDTKREIREFELQLREIGSPSDHSWIGSNRTEPILPAERTALQNELDSLRETLSYLMESSSELTRILGIGDQSKYGLKDLQKLAQFGFRITKAPRMAPESVDHPAWKNNAVEIGTMVREGHGLKESMKALEAIVSPVGWNSDLMKVRKGLASFGSSFFRLLSKDYREAVSSLRGMLKCEIPKDSKNRLELVDRMLEVQSTNQKFSPESYYSQLGRGAFGSFWKGVDSDWSQFGSIVEWDNENRNSDLIQNPRTVLARLNEQESCERHLKVVSEKLKRFSTKLLELIKYLSSHPEFPGQHS